jgi:hypothetical protein
MKRQDPHLLNLVRQVEDRSRAALIERAAKEGLTPNEVQRAMEIERNWRRDRDMAKPGWGGQR